MIEYMTKKEIDDLVREIMNFPKVESNNPVSTMHGFDVDTLINTPRDFKRLPTYDEVLKQNQKYKEVIDKAIKYINDNSWYFNDEDSGAMFCLEEEKEETFCNDLLSILKEVE